jgi:hypothetical protein
MNGADTVARGDKQPFVINGPGEYEFREMFIEGFLSKTNYDGKERINTIYALEIDKMQIAFLGAHGEPDVSNEVKVAANIAFGHHGFGELFTNDNPFVMIAMARTADEADTYKAEIAKALEENQNYKDGKIKVDAMVIE